jgi:O-antigen/teichoic acid export membrane protein
MTARVGGGVWALGRRLSLGLVDQSVSSLTNFVAAVLVARAMPPAEFGAFSVAFAAYLVPLGVSRALGSEVLVVRFAAQSPDGRRRGVQASVGSALLVGLAGSACSLAGAASTSGSLQRTLLALAVTLPGLLVQDAWRYAFFLEGRGGKAAANDLVWALVLFPALVVLTRSGLLSSSAAFLTWGGSGTVAALVGMVQARTLPRPGLAPAWWRAHRDLGPRYVGEFVAFGAYQVSVLAVSAVAGLGAAGTLRAGQLLMGPITVLFMGVGLVAIPEAARVAAASPARLGRSMAALSWSLAALAGAWGATMAILPGHVGTRIFGRAWGPAHSIVVPLAIVMIALGATSGAHMGLRALAAARRGLRARTIAAVLVIVFTLAGAAVDGARGAAFGMATATVLAMVLYWSQWRRALAEHRQGVPTEPPPDAARVSWAS